MPVASLVRVIFAADSTAPVGSATRPRMRPLAPCAGSNAGSNRERATRQTIFRQIVFGYIVPRHILVQRARSDGMEPPGILKKKLFSLKAIACVSLQPCYNPARLEKGKAHCQG